MPKIVFFSGKDPQREMAAHRSWRIAIVKSENVQKNGLIGGEVTRSVINKGLKDLDMAIQLDSIRQEAKNWQKKLTRLKKRIHDYSNKTIKFPNYYKVTGSPMEKFNGNYKKNGTYLEHPIYSNGKEYLFYHCYGKNMDKKCGWYLGRVKSSGSVSNIAYSYRNLEALPGTKPDHHSVWTSYKNVQYPEIHITETQEVP